MLFNFFFAKCSDKLLRKTFHNNLKSTPTWEESKILRFSTVGEQKILITFPYHQVIKYSVSVPLIMKSYLDFLRLVSSCLRYVLTIVSQHKRLSSTMLTNTSFKDVPNIIMMLTWFQTKPLVLLYWLSVVYFKEEIIIEFIILIN